MPLPKAIRTEIKAKPKMCIRDRPYLDTFSKEHKLNLAVLTAVHLEPMGVYSKSIKNVADLPDGAKIAVPNDPTNGGRALKVLETAGILKVRPEAGILASPADIVDNPKHVKIVEVEAAQLPRALDDVDAAVINSNYALAAKLNPTKDAIAIEMCIRDRRNDAENLSERFMI